MFLKRGESGDLIEIANIEELFDPFVAEIKGRSQQGQEEQNLESFSKTDLIFPSGESLPKCWLTAEYAR
jgi:hypothetical protein